MNLSHGHDKPYYITAARSTKYTGATRPRSHGDEMPADYVIESNGTAIVHAGGRAPPGTAAATCVVCKGRRFCGQQQCPILSSLSVTFRNRPSFSHETVTRALDIHLGTAGFPQEPAGVVLGEQGLGGSATRDEAFARLRTSGYATAGTRGAGSLALNDLALSDRPVSVRITWETGPADTAAFSAASAPRMHPGTYAKIEIEGPVHVPAAVKPLLGREESPEPVIAEGRAAGLDPDYLSRLHALGMFGAPPWQIPTRWAQATVYDICSRAALHHIKGWDVLGEPALYVADALGDPFFILLLSRPWEFELIETWAPNTVWTLGERDAITVHEHETYRGASDLALREGGSYFSTRLGITELLEREHRQAAALVVRASQPGASTPLGSSAIYRAVAGARRIGTYATEDDALEALASAAGLGVRSLGATSMILQQGRLTAWF